MKPKNNVTKTNTKGCKADKRKQGKKYPGKMTVKIRKKKTKDGVNKKKKENILKIDGKHNISPAVDARLILQLIAVAIRR